MQAFGHEDIDPQDGQGADGGEAPAWAVFGDLMAGLVGVFVLLLVAVMGSQM